jgi:hypothetical protein
MNWSDVVSKINPYIVKIETQNGSGTGFLCLYNQDRTIVGIATANHVVAYAAEWDQPIRIRHSGGEVLTLPADSNRAIRSNTMNDSAVIICFKQNLPFPDTLIPLLPKETTLPIGAEVGWLGYPSIEPYQACFFCGNISAHRTWPAGYLVDGVAINGVSGGPVFFSHPTDGVHFVGAVSAYHANRTTGEALPGLLVAQDVSHFHEVVTDIKTIDEARAKELPAESAP